MARQRVLGLPIGKKKRPVRQVAGAVGKAAAVIGPVLAVPAARRAIPAARRVGEAAQGAGDLIHKGEELAGKASDAVNTASNLKEAASSHSSTIGKVGGIARVLAKGGKSGGGSKPKLSHLIEQHTDIAAPRSVVYNQWTQLEMFPTLTKGIESVEQDGDEKAQWTSKIGPSRRRWTAHTVEQIPDERIAWKSEGGAQVQGVVTFHSLDEDLTRVLLQMEYKPTGAVEWVGNTLRIQRRRAKRDLRLFKHFVEMRGEETGAWRGRIDDGSLEPQFAGQGGGGGRDNHRANGKGERGGRRDEGSAGRSSAGRSSAGRSSADRSSGGRSSADRSSGGRSSGGRSSGRRPAGRAQNGSGDKRSRAAAGGSR